MRNGRDAPRELYELCTCAHVQNAARNKYVSFIRVFGNANYSHGSDETTPREHEIITVHEAAESILVSG